MHERRAFEYFFRCAAPVFAGVLDAEFWRYLVPQLCQSEPIIWDAVLAISTLFEHPQYDASIMLDLPGDRPPPTNQHHQLALVAYNRALSRFRGLSEPGLSALPLAIISCVLFICVESLQDNINQALSLLRVGFNLLSTHLRTNDVLQFGTNGGSSLDAMAAPMFLRLGCLSAIMGHSPSEDFKMQLSMKYDSNFSTLERARYSLHAMMLRGHKFFRAADTFIRDHLPPDPVPPDLISEQRYLITECLQWEDSFSKMMREKEPQWTPTEKNFASSFFAWSITYRVWMAASLSFFQSTIDQFHAEIEALLEYARQGVASTIDQDNLQPHFTFEMGVIPPLHLTALRCRHPVLRRQALLLLKASPRKGGLWKAISLTRFVQKIIELEEHGLFPQPISWDDLSLGGQAYRLPPEEKRLHAFETFQKNIGSSQQGWVMRYKTLNQDDKGSWRPVYHEIGMDTVFAA